MDPEVRAAALEIVRENREADPCIQDVYLFPADNEIRLVHIDPNTMPHRGNGSVIPFYFGRDLQSGLLYRSAIALIRPEEREALRPPDDWGTWNDAEVIKE
jgi:hypothetical protein